MKLQDFKYSYNRFYKIYRVQLFEHGNWRKCTYDKNNLEFIITNNLKTTDQIRNFPYKPYFLHRIKWSIMNLWKWILKTDTKAQKFVKSGFVIIITYFLGLITNCDFFKSENSNPKETQETIDINHKVKILETFSDSVLTEIKQKELIIKEFQLAQKDSTLRNETD